MASKCGNYTTIWPAVVPPGQGDCLFSAAAVVVVVQALGCRDNFTGLELTRDLLCCELLGTGLNFIVRMFRMWPWRVTEQCGGAVSVAWTKGVHRLHMLTVANWTKPVLIV